MIWSNVFPMSLRILLCNLFLTVVSITSVNQIQNVILLKARFKSHTQLDGKLGSHGFMRGSQVVKGQRYVSELACDRVRVNKPAHNIWKNCAPQACRKDSKSFYLLYVYSGLYYYISFSGIPALFSRNFIAKFLVGISSDEKNRHPSILLSHVKTRRTSPVAKFYFWNPAPAQKMPSARHHRLPSNTMWLKPMRNFLLRFWAVHSNRLWPRLTKDKGCLAHGHGQLLSARRDSAVSQFDSSKKIWKSSGGQRVSLVIQEKIQNRLHESQATTNCDPGHAPIEFWGVRFWNPPDCLHVKKEQVQWDRGSTIARWHCLLLKQGQIVKIWDEMSSQLSSHRGVLQKSELS